MSSTRVFQATRLLTRQRRQVVAGSCLGLSVGTGVRFDTYGRSGFSTSAPAPSRRDGEDRGMLRPELMKQLSGGSVTGFVAGLLVSIFSRTLVLLVGVSVVVVQVAARYGINIVNQLRLKQRLGKSRVLAALEKDPIFTVSFGLFFALSAFMQF